MVQRANPCLRGEAGVVWVQWFTAKGTHLELVACLLRHGLAHVDVARDGL